jgi:hypothetical protein
MWVKRAQHHHFHWTGRKNALTLSRVCDVGNLSLYTDRVGREHERNETYLTHILLNLAGNVDEHPTGWRRPK